MEQIKELFDILKSTPEMALYGLLIWCLYILLKLSSVVYAIKVVIQLGINRWHQIKLAEIQLKREEVSLENKDDLYKEREELQKARELHFKESVELESIKNLSQIFNKMTVGPVEKDRLIELLKRVKGDGNYIHNRDIDKAIEKLKK